MKNEISEILKWSKILSILTTVLGVLLMVYMIKIEGEPGALSLLLIVGGLAWLIINRFKIKKATAVKN